MMATETLKALVNTIIKQSTIDSSQITDLTQKFPLLAGDEFNINDYKSAANNHWELELTSPVNEVTKWYAYIPHVTIISSSTTESIVKEIKNNTRFNVYHQSTEQDYDGKGIPPNGQDNRSERICPVYVLSPRRQTDSLVRQLVNLLPIKNTAFIIAERLVQYPEDYLPTISQLQKAVLVQSFVGIGDSSSSEPVPRHEKELWRLEQSIRLLKSMNRDISAVVCAMGDSMSPVAKEVREKVQTRLYSLLDQYNLSEIKQPITWGADELVAMAIAQTLPTTKVRIRIANDDTQLHYDAHRKPSEVVQEKLPALGLIKTEMDWDFEVAILTRRKNGSIDDYQKDDVKQAQLDNEFLAQYKNYSPEQRTRLVIIDGRLFNGAWNTTSVLPYDDLLAFGAWGTFGNCVGSTLAVAKVLYHAKNPVAQKQLYLEAVAHDVFANGYKEVQRWEEPNSFYNQLKNQTGITQITNLEEQIMSKLSILIDPGHSPIHPGTEAKDGTPEYDLNLLQAKIVKAELDKANIPAEIFDPESDPRDLIGQKAADHSMFLSLHHNAYDKKPHYTCVMIHPTKAKPQSITFAKKLSTAVANAIGQKDFGTMENSVTVLSESEDTNCPICILCESYFLDAIATREEAEKLSTKAAYAIASTVITELQPVSHLRINNPTNDAKFESGVAELGYD